MGVFNFCDYVKWNVSFFIFSFVWYLNHGHKLFCAFLCFGATIVVCWLLLIVSLRCCFSADGMFMFGSCFINFHALKLSKAYMRNSVIKHCIKVLKNGPWQWFQLQSQGFLRQQLQLKLRSSPQFKTLLWSDACFLNLSSGIDSDALNR